jgi:RNA polymerase sigma-70 factor (ECF subfamily)
MLRERCNGFTDTRQGRGTDESADERELIERAQAGDRDAYARLVTAHGAAATRAAAWFGAGPEVDDVVQEAFVKAWQGLGRFHTDAPFRPWLMRIVANQTRNTIRSRRRRDALALRALDPSVPPDPAQSAEAAARDAVLLEAVRRLRPEQRDVVVCRWFLGLDEAGTATALGIPRGTAKSRASRALARLREELSETEVAL